MASLQSALHALAPLNFNDVPKSTRELDHYLAELYSESQTIVESIPIADPGDVQPRPRAQTTGSIASNASEMSTSSARSEPPPSHLAALQKDWGKPLKLKPAENVLGISVYKTSGKDGRGAWFARRSVHEGLGFARFKAAFEKEFSTSLAVQGAPGEGNIRGIGAETRVEQIDVPNRGRMEVYRLSAQFPGPTTPRDFVTFLATSSKALKHHSEQGQAHELTPRHYMIISKPCNHPETQPRNGFIRGQYESVEFIREIPRKLKASTSQTNLNQPNHPHHKHGHDLAQDMLVRNAEQLHSLPPGSEQDKSHLPVPHSSSRDQSPSGRRRSHTFDVPDRPSKISHEGAEYDPEDNPVEWIMVTRSDPGGSVPRFLVERGTPASICADAVKFLDWACQQDEEVVQSPDKPSKLPRAFRRESFTSFEAEERLSGITETNETSGQVSHDSVSETPQSVARSHTNMSEQSVPSRPDSAASGSSGIMASVAGVLSAYVPHAVSDHFPHAASDQLSGTTPRASPGLKPRADYEKHHADGAIPSKHVEDDAASTISSVSWASADSHINSDLDPEAHSISSQQNSLSSNPPSNQNHDQHEKELNKLSQRKAALDAKFAQHREKLSKQNETATEKEQAALKKAEEKHERDLKKHEERYQREIKKVEERKKKEGQKLEAKKRKQGGKDEKEKLRRERDENAQRLQILEKEREVWVKQVGELQKENTALMARIGKLEAAAIEGGGSRSRSNSVLRKKKLDEGEAVSPTA